LPEIALLSLCLLIRSFRFGCLPRWRSDLQLDKLFVFPRSLRFLFYSPVFVGFLHCVYFSNWLAFWLFNDCSLCAFVIVVAIYSRSLCIWKIFWLIYISFRVVVVALRESGRE